MPTDKLNLICDNCAEITTWHVVVITKDGMTAGYEFTCAQCGHTQNQ